VVLFVISDEASFMTATEFVVDGGIIICCDEEKSVLNTRLDQPAPDGPPPNPNPRKPKLAVPKGACDSHCHIYGPFDRFPLPPDRTFTPNEAPETALRRLHDHHGFDRAVIVQSQGHGLDHEPLLDALTTGGGRYRGVALIGPNTGQDILARFDAAGICGIRFNFMAHLGGNPDLDTVRATIALVQPYNWHIAIHVADNGLVETEDFIRSIRAPVVIDHMARPGIAEGPNGPAMTTLRSLLDTGRIWVKVRSADRLSKFGAPFSDVVPLARSLVEHAPERILWGSDWPHVNLHGPMPDDGDLVDFIGEIAPAEHTRHLILAENPREFFGFN
jgi:2-pyrone-4,6-dicarboxylate lactonase